MGASSTLVSAKEQKLQLQCIHFMNSPIDEGLQIVHYAIRPVFAAFRDQPVHLMGTVYHHCAFRGCCQLNFEVAHCLLGHSEASLEAF